MFVPPRDHESIHASQRRAFAPASPASEQTAPASGTTLPMGAQPGATADAAAQVLAHWAEDGPTNQTPPTQTAPTCDSGEPAGDAASQEGSHGPQAVLDKDQKKGQKFAKGTPADHAAAKVRHQANLQYLDALLHEGKDAKDSKWGQKWPNASQWLLAGKTKLHALTETHDSVARAAALGAGAGERAYFGIHVAVPNASDYNAAVMTDAANIDSNNPSTLGYRQAGSPSKIAILDPVTKSRELVQETIVHEVQHDADHHPSDSSGRFLSEFNAYWIDKTFQAKSADSGTAVPTLTTGDGTLLTGFDNARQQRIFQHLYDGYKYVPTAWNGDPAFKVKVLAHKRPEGSNLIDSVRIDDLYLELTKSPADYAAAKVKLKKLTEHDRAALQDSSMATPWKQLLAHLADQKEADFFRKELHIK